MKRKVKGFKKITADTKRLLAGQENRDVEFKINHKGVGTEDFVAFANAGGGTIFVGVEEVTSKEGYQSGSIIGCKIDDETRLSLVSKAASCRPAIDVSIQIENVQTDTPILRIDIPEGDNKPYSTTSGTYKIRADGRNVGIDPPLMRAMILEVEAEEFVARFRHAAEEVIRHLSQVRKDLSQQIERVQKAAELASESALRAEGAAEEAIAAAFIAAAAAEDAASSMEF